MDGEESQRGGWKIGRGGEGWCYLDGGRGREELFLSFRVRGGGGGPRIRQIEVYPLEQREQGSRGRGGGALLEEMERRCRSE